MSIDIYSAINALQNPEELTTDVALGYLSNLRLITEKRLRDELDTDIYNHNTTNGARAEFSMIFDEGVDFHEKTMQIGKKFYPITTEEQKAVANELVRVVRIIQRIGQQIDLDDMEIFEPIKTPPYQKVLDYLISCNIVSQMDISIFILHVKRGYFSKLVVCKGNKEKMVFCAYRLSKFFSRAWRDQVIIDLETDNKHFSSSRQTDFFKKFPI